MTQQLWQPGTPLPFEQAENFRELGGYRTEDGRRVKRGLFYRCGALCEIESERDRELFRSLGIRVICDLRSTQERQIQPDPEFPGVIRHDISAMLDEHGNEVNFDPRTLLTMTPEEVQATSRQVNSKYALLPLDNPAYRAMFSEIRAGNFPILFHCSAGKDRTGVAAALILRMLGVPRETAVWDYMHTNDCRVESTRKMVAVYRERFRGHPELEDLIRVLTGVEQRLIEAALDAVDAHYPSFDAYLQDQYGIGPGELSDLRDACLE